MKANEKDWNLQRSNLVLNVENFRSWRNDYSETTISINIKTFHRNYWEHYFLNSVDPQTEKEVLRIFPVRLAFPRISECHVPFPPYSNDWFVDMQFILNPGRLSGSGDNSFYALPLRYRYLFDREGERLLPVSLFVYPVLATLVYRTLQQVTATKSTELNSLPLFIDIVHLKTFQNYCCLRWKSFHYDAC